MTGCPNPEWQRPVKVIKCRHCVSLFLKIRNITDSLRNEFSLTAREVFINSP
jgi:hypothetical protein